ncbi:hypothetical protein [Runella sp.]|uniref:hypothetical protein n=1 Tax=Runella sp. TaxID=1960881 RepID=UPI003D09A96B
MDLENNEFLLFTACAEQCQLQYLIIGGFAMYLNGLNRATNDIDIWIKPSVENGKKLIEVLLCMGYTAEELDDLAMLDFRQPQIFGINEELDILTQVHYRFDFDHCFLRAGSCKNGQGNTLYFLHLNDLRDLKVIAQRPQDLRDVIMIDDFLKLRQTNNENNEPTN